MSQTQKIVCFGPLFPTGANGYLCCSVSITCRTLATAHSPFTGMWNNRDINVCDRHFSYFFFFLLLMLYVDFNIYIDKPLNLFFCSFWDCWLLQKVSLPLRLINLFLNFHLLIFICISIIHLAKRGLISFSFNSK